MNYFYITLNLSVHVDYRFHPIIHRVKEILESKDLGAIKDISVKILLPSGSFGDNDIGLIIFPKHN